MRLIVTGGAGFIGSAVVRLALELGHSVLNLDKLTYASNLMNLSKVESHPDYSFVQADICEKEILIKIFQEYQPDAVMHLAAESHVDRSISGPGLFVDTNIKGTLNLLEVMRDYWETRGRSDSIRFHHISTDEVFGSLDIDSDLKFSEISNYQPNSPYSASKAGSDHLVRAWHTTYGLPVIITNCSNNYGPFQFPEKLVPLVITNALRGKKIPVYGDGSNVRDWLHVEDHADALFKVLEKGRLGETYLIGCNSEYSNIELVKKICEFLNAVKPSKSGSYMDLIQFVPDRLGHDERYAINFDKIQNELGWEPSVKIDQGLKSTINWYIENENWWKPLLQ